VSDLQPEESHVYLAIDPGEHIGYAWFDEVGRPIANAEITGHNEFMDWLEEGPVPKKIIYETYRNRPWAEANRWADNKTSMLIGMILRYAHKNDVELVSSEPANLYIGLRFLGLYARYRKQGKSKPHVPNGLSALAHGVYMLQKLHIRKHVVN
jgi:hypothetical protein